MGTSLDRSALLGLVLCAGPLAVLAHGFFGAGSIVTGLLMALPIAALILTGKWRGFSPNICDALFAVVICCVAVSFIANGLGPDAKEPILLALTVAAYPAARLSERPFELKGLILVTGLVVTAGTLTTIPYLLQQWNDSHGKPFVFGLFDAAPTQFSMALCIGLFAVASHALTTKKAIMISAAVALPTAVFAASMVRFTLLAMLVALGMGALVGPREQRKPTLLMICLLAAIVVVGLVARAHTTMAYLDHFATSAAFKGLRPDANLRSRPSDLIDKAMLRSSVPVVQSCEPIDIDNSLAIRKRLFKDAMELLPSSSVAGIGLDGFAAATCLTGHPAHNTLFQTIIEIGWPGGVALVLLSFFALGRKRLLSLAKISPEVHFVICSLTFAMLISLMYGRLSRDTALFLFLGYAAALRSESVRIAKGCPLGKT
jgi:hypothetical protein